MSLEASGIELKRREDNDRGLGNEGLGFLDSEGYLSLFHRRVIRSERDHHALGILGCSSVTNVICAGAIRPGLSLGVQPPGARQRLQPRERDTLACLAAYARSEQLVAPIRLP